MRNKRYIYFDLLKIISAVFVIFNHSHQYLKGTGIWFNIFHMASFNIVKIAVPIFIMITGALMLKKKCTYEIILKKRILRVYIATFISTIVGCLFFKLSFFSTLLKTFFGAQTSVLYFLWYMYLLITLYLLTPILKRMIRGYKDKDYRTFFVIFIIIPSTIYFISNFFELVLVKYKLMENLFYQFLYLVYVGYFVFGYYISKKEIDMETNKKALICNFCAFMVGNIYLGIGFINNHDIVELFCTGITTAVMSMCTFISFKYYFGKLKYGNFFSKVIVNMSESSFGVYLMHLYVIEYLVNTKFIANLMSFNNLIGYGTLISITYFSLTLFFYLIRKIPIFRKIF